jgi:REP element-mobilizing transposase RayT
VEVAVPQSLARVLVHLVFSTKNRVPALAPEVRTELHPYLAAVLTNDGCPSLRVGGVEDHVHLLFALSRTRTIAQVVENVKTSSSKWLKAKWPPLADFHWQSGYGIFSVSQSQADGVVDYILRQEEHHKAESFQQELRRRFEEQSLAYDERYVWD